MELAWKTRLPPSTAVPSPSQLMLTATSPGEPALKSLSMSKTRFKLHQESAKTVICGSEGKRKVGWATSLSRATIRPRNMSSWRYFSITIKLQSWTPTNWWMRACCWALEVDLRLRILIRLRRYRKIWKILKSLLKRTTETSLRTGTATIRRRYFLQLWSSTGQKRSKSNPRCRKQGLKMGPLLILDSKSVTQSSRVITS